MGNSKIPFDNKKMQIAPGENKVPADYKKMQISPGEKAHQRLWTAKVNAKIAVIEAIKKEKIRTIYREGNINAIKAYLGTGIFYTVSLLAMLFGGVELFSPDLFDVLSNAYAGNFLLGGLASVCGKHTLKYIEGFKK